MRRIIDQKTAANLVTSLVLTRLDYCNAVYAGLPKSTTSFLQRVQNAATRLVAGSGPRDHITPVLHSLHWLPVVFRVTFKLCLLMHLVHTGRSPSYLTEIVQLTSSLPNRSRLRSADSQRYELPRLALEFCERAFSYAGPAAWNKLPATLHSITATSTFKRQLKTHLFGLAFASF